jgi:hypothetical protein
MSISDAIFSLKTDMLGPASVAFSDASSNSYSMLFDEAPEPKKTKTPKRSMF